MLIAKPEDQKPAMTDQVAQVLDYAPKVLILIIFAVLAVNAYLKRNMPRVGGKIGRRSGLPAEAAPNGFSRVDCREITLFGAPSDAKNYPNLKTYLRDGPVRRQSLVRIYRVAACKTSIEISAEPPHYQRIDAAEALALLRELPDPRLVDRLHLSDQPSFLDPWVRRVTGQDGFLLGNATNTGLIVLYLPDRRFGRMLGLTLLHEWLHLVAFKSARHIRRFKRANAIEPLTPPAINSVSFGDPRTPIYEAWCELGESLLGYDETIARQAAMESPVHAMILWRRIEQILRRVPARLRCTRLSEFQTRAAFMHKDAEPRARAAWSRRGQLRSLWLSR